MPNRTVRVAFLNVGELAPELEARHGNLAALFRSLFRLAQPEGSKQDVEVVLDEYEVRQGQWPDMDSIDKYDAAIIPGSAATAFDDSLPWLAPLMSVVRTIFEQHPRMKLIGICFGHQVIARALGGECETNAKGWELGVAEVELSDAGKALFGQDVLRIQQMHRDHVPAVPSSYPFHLLGSTARAPVQGLVLYHSSTPPSPASVRVFTLQGHPEFSISGDIVTSIIDLREQNGIFPAQVAEDGRTNAVKDNDGIGVAGRVILRVLGVE